MRLFIPFLVTALILLSSIFLATGILSFFFIMMGRLIVLCTNFTLFEATMLCVTVTFVDAFIIFVFLYIKSKGSTGFNSQMDDDEGVIKVKFR